MTTLTRTLVTRTVVTRTLVTRGFGEPAGVLGRVGGRLMARGNGPTERHMIELAELQPGQTVFLVGPGPGIGVQAAVATGAARVIAVDPSPVMLAACRRRCAGVEGVELEFVSGTAADTGQGDQVADVVVTVNNTFLWPDRGAGLG